MRQDGYLGNPRYTSMILKLDQEYVRSLSQSLFGDSKVDKAEWVHNTIYYKPEFRCCLCGAGNKRRHNRPAAFFPTAVGYLYTCLSCNPSLTLYQFLRQEQPAVACNYQKDRWLKKLTGKGFNCPDAPKNIRREHYQQIEREQKEKNYLRKHGFPPN